MDFDCVLLKICLFIWPTFHYLTLQRNIFMFLHIIQLHKVTVMFMVMWQLTLSRQNCIFMQFGVKLSSLRHLWFSLVCTWMCRYRPHKWLSGVKTNNLFYIFGILYKTFFARMYRKHLKGHLVKNFSGKLILLVISNSCFLAYLNFPFPEDYFYVIFIFFYTTVKMIWVRGWGYYTVW